MADNKSVMSLVVGLTDDVKRVELALLQDGKQLGWVELTPEQADQVIKNISKYSTIITSAKPKGIVH